ncbi:STAS domain-containing protein [Actinokineospora sp. NBRC 105648]|uniref:STAS domain-containing protein n=1 Tax=Actinokineospora sp. NBRC 105648 TaxID=3032206 RepID=UPI002556FB3A|nr:STAS domain-containing protein [Actinokineospora sp. NBRC 105648]
MHHFNPLWTIEVRGEVDATSAWLLTEPLMAATEGAAGHVVLDLSEVTFFGSHGLLVVLDAHHRATRRGVTLVVVCNRGVSRLFEVTGVAGTLCHDMVRV